VRRQDDALGPSRNGDLHDLLEQGHRATVAVALAEAPSVLRRRRRLSLVAG
jgi:hypothetical protein